MNEVMKQLLVAIRAIDMALRLLPDTVDEFENRNAYWSAGHNAMQVRNNLQTLIGSMGRESTARLRG